MKLLLVLLTLSFFQIRESEAQVPRDNCDANFCYQHNVKRIYVTGVKNRSYILFSGDTANLSCELEGGRYIEIPRSSENYDSLYALALTAFIHDKKISAKISAGTNNECRADYLYID